MSDADSINEWTLDEIDLDKPLVDLHDVINDRNALNDALFEHLNKKELNKIFGCLRNEAQKKDDLDFERIKKLCLTALERLPNQKIIKLIDLELDGKKADLSLTSDLDDEKKESQKTKESSDDIQMNVDDEEYEDFLNAECINDEPDNQKDSKSNKASSNGKSSKNLSQKDQQNLINELAFTSIPPNENFDNCQKSSVQDESGWENLFHQTQLEIQELEMRANAIKAMMEKSNRRLSDQSTKDDIKDKNSHERKELKDNSKNDQLLDDIESEDDYVTEEDEDSISKDKKSREKSEEMIEPDFLEIKVKVDQKRINKANKRDLERFSVESGEIFEEEDDDHEIYLAQKKKSKVDHYEQQYKRIKSPVSVTSSIDSFGRNRRRSRSHDKTRDRGSRSYDKSRGRSDSRGRSNSSSFGSLDEILREAELEEERRSDTNKSKSHSHRHHHHHKK